MSGPSLHQQVDEINDLGIEKIGRVLNLRVERVLTKVPPPSILRKKQINVYVCSANTFEARKLRDYLTACLEDGVPGPISFGLHATEEL